MNNPFIFFRSTYLTFVSSRYFSHSHSCFVSSLSSTCFNEKVHRGSRQTSLPLPQSESFSQKAKINLWVFLLVKLSVFLSCNWYFPMTRVIPDEMCHHFQKWTVKNLLCSSTAHFLLNPMCVYVHPLLNVECVHF